MNLVRESRKKGGANNDYIQNGALPLKSRPPSLEVAYLLWPYLCLLLAGTVATALIAVVRKRGTVTMTIAGLAMFVLIVQLVIGFPLANAATEINKVGAEDTLKCGYLISFWLSVLVLVAAGVVGFVQFHGYGERFRIGKNV